MSILKRKTRKGYVMLLTVLVVGTVASASAIATLLLGLSIERNAFSISLSSQADNLARSCMEIAIKELQNDLNYTGNKQESIRYGYIGADGGLKYGYTGCEIYPVMGEGNEDRTICSEGTFGNWTTRRLEVVLDRVLPSTRVDSWEEVPTVTACDPFTGPPASDCGNGFEQGDEECDDGNNIGNDSCNSVCLDEFCGDDVVQSFLGEECDDGGECNGGANDGEACDAVADCPGGTCDPQAGDGCNEFCVSEVCGDSTLHTGEECDDGNTTTGDGCSSACEDEFCGDEYLDEDGPDNIGGNSDDEECDDGGLCVGGANDGLTCNSTTDCPGGTCTPQAGDGCDTDCAIEVSLDPAPTDYIMYWKLDETSTGGSDSTVDSSGNGYHGTPQSGPTSSTDVPTLSTPSVRSFDFDGSNDRIKGSKSSDLFPDEVTISFWTKNNVIPSANDGIMCKTNSTTWSKGWGFIYSSSNEIQFFIQNWSQNYARSSIIPTQWNHVAGVYDGSNIYVYVNGVLGATTDTYAGTLNKKSRIYIGRCGSNNPANSYNIDGKIDDFRIYNYALTEEEIQSLAAGL